MSKTGTRAIQSAIIELASELNELAENLTQSAYGNDTNEDMLETADGVLDTLSDELTAKYKLIFDELFTKHVRYEHIR